MSYRDEIKDQIIYKKEFTMQALLWCLKQGSFGVYRTSNAKLFSHIVQTLKDYEIHYESKSSKLFGKMPLHEITIEKFMDYERPTSRDIAIVSFLLYGRLAKPQKSYHLDFECQDESFYEVIQEVFSEQEIYLSLTKRRNHQVLYTKDAQKIIDTLYFLGCNKEATEIENQRILRDMKKNIKQMINFEVANEQRVQKSSNRQIEAIETIQSTMGLSVLREELIEIAQLRLDYPEDSLTEIANRMDPPLSKSGVRHRFNEIEKIAQKLRR